MVTDSDEPVINPSSSTVTPRFLVQYTLFNDDESINHVAYEANQLQGSLHKSDRAVVDVIGFAEIPPYTSIGRYQSFDAFKSKISTVSDHIHWKPGVVNDA